MKKKKTSGKRSKEKIFIAFRIKKKKRSEKKRRRKSKDFLK